MGTADCVCACHRKHAFPSGREGMEQRDGLLDGLLMGVLGLVCLRGCWEAHRIVISISIKEGWTQECDVPNFSTFTNVSGGRYRRSYCWKMTLGTKMYYSAYHSQHSVKNTDLRWWLNFLCSLSPGSLSLHKNLFAPFFLSLPPVHLLLWNSVDIHGFFFILFDW